MNKLVDPEIFHEMMIMLPDELSCDALVFDKTGSQLRKNMKVLLLVLSSEQEVRFL